MPDYKKSKIYKLVSNHTNEIYIGATVNYLRVRKSEHKKHYKRWGNGKHGYITSYEIVKYDDCKIILVEEFPCDSKIQLSSRERYWIEKLKCVNKCIPTRTKKEWTEDNKERYKILYKKYYQKNKEKITSYKKEYAKQNKEKIIMYKKNYYQKNREKTKLKSKKNYVKNKDKNKEKMQCDCGVLVYSLRKHMKSQTHLDLTLLNIGDIF